MTTSSPLNMSHLYALVDMGSNGIRFSISDLSAPAARLIPTVYQSRSSISIYDAQHNESGSRIPIRTETISKVVSSLESFLKVCRTLLVPSENIRVLATEATRTAPNSEDFRQQIKTATGLTVELLSKEDEGRIGALGIVSSFPAPLAGIILDLGGGSVQISWTRQQIAHSLERSKTAISMPFGAAAMMARLDSGTKPKDLSSEIMRSFQDALAQLDVPGDILNPDGDGVTLFLSGGGFRGWGYALMDRHQIQPYPIPIINGFSVDAEQFNPKVVLGDKSSNAITDDMFRISERRASQAPAVTLLITSLLSALPKVSRVSFAQGGVREGTLYNLLSSVAQFEHPLVAATAAYATVHRELLAEMIESAIPLQANDSIPLFLYSSHSRRAFTLALASLINHHGPCPKDIRASAALRSSTSGVLASTHGLTHEIRAWLALGLLGRWAGSREDLPKTDCAFYDGLSQLLGAEESWWAGYVGRVAGVVGELYFTGQVAANDNTGWQRVVESAGSNGGNGPVPQFMDGEQRWGADWTAIGKKGKAGIVLSVGTTDDENVRKAVLQLAKWGKKKKWEQRLVKGHKVEIRGLDLEDSD